MPAYPVVGPWSGSPCSFFLVLDDKTRCRGKVVAELDDCVKLRGVETQFDNRLRRLVIASVRDFALRMKLPPPLGMEVRQHQIRLFLAQEDEAIRWVQNADPQIQLLACPPTDPAFYSFYWRPADNLEGLFEVATFAPGE